MKKLNEKIHFILIKWFIKYRMLGTWIVNIEKVEKYIIGTYLYYYMFITFGFWTYDIGQIRKYVP